MTRLRHIRLAVKGELAVLCLLWMVLLVTGDMRWLGEAGESGECLQGNLTGTGQSQAGQGTAQGREKAGGQMGTGDPGEGLRGTGALLRRVAGPAGGFGGMESHADLLSATPGETCFQFELGGYEVREVEIGGRKRSTVSVSDGWLSQERGCPALPRYRFTLASPGGKGVRLEVRNSRWEEIPCAPPVASLGMHSRHEMPAYGERAEVYEGGGIWPDKPAVLGAEARIRQVALVGVTVMAAAYDFGRGVMRVCRGCEVRMVSEEASASDYGKVSEELDFRRLQTRGVVNRKLLRGQSDSTRAGTLMMLVPDGWKAPVEGYGAWKSQLGFRVFVCGYPSETGQGSAGIGQRIRRGYGEEGVTHVVLVGRGVDLPPAIFLPADKRENPRTQLAVSDVPYGLLAGDDFRQDVFLSRLGVSSASELSGVLDKLRGYERQRGLDSWRGKGIFVASDQGYDGEPEIPDEFWGKCDIDVVEGERNLLLDRGAFSEIHAEYVPWASRQGLMSAWNGGAGLLTYMGHGGSYCWVTTGFSSSDVMGLANGNRLPFVSSCVCLTGNFGAAGPSLGEALVAFSDGGACGMLASTNEVYIFPPMYMMQRLHQDILGAAGNDRLVTLGGYALSAIGCGMDYCSATSADGEFAEDTELLAKQFHLLGDCSLAGRFRPSSDLRVETRRKSALGILEVQVFCGGVGRVGSNVMVWGENGHTWSERTGADGLAQLHLGEQLGERLRIAAYDPLGGYVEVGQVETADRDGDGLVSHDEMLESLKEGMDTEKGRQAVREWTASGSAEYVEGRENRQPGELVQAGMQEENAYEFDCRRNPGGTCLDDQEGVSVGSPEDVVRRLEDLWMAHWEVCRPFHVGKSAEGRPILGVRLGSMEPLDGTRVQLLVTGGLHGDEESSVDVALGLAERLLALRQDQAFPLHKQIQDVLRRCWVYVIPCLNPDGLACSQRGNAQGLDLDRAFPDGLSANLGTYAQGDSLRLWERLESHGGEGIARGEIPEVRAVMRWCGAHRLTAALLLHSGGRHVYYPYGGSQNGQIGEQMAPDRELLEELARGYADATHRSDDSPCNGAAWAPVSGEMGDWLYRYLGVLPLTVEVSGMKLCPLFEDWDGKTVDDQLPGFMWWLDRCLKGVGGRVIDRAGKGVAGVGITLRNENPIFTDADGRFFKLGAGKSSQMMLFFSRQGYETVVAQGVKGRHSVSVKMTAQSGAGISGRLRHVRPVPGQVEWLDVLVTQGQSSSVAQVIQVALPAGWRVVEPMMPDSVLAWRWESTGGIAVLVPGGDVELSLPLQVGGVDTAGDVLNLACHAGGTKTMGGTRGLSAERATSVLRQGLSSMAVVPERPLDARAPTWRNTHYDVEPLSEWCRGYWLFQDLGTVTGWFDEKREIDLLPGWNAIGVPWRMPVPRHLGNVMGDENGVYVVVKEMVPGRGYWIFSKKRGHLNW